MRLGFSRFEYLLLAPWQVMTTRSASANKRAAVRKMWRHVDGGQGRLCARFVICNQATDNFQQALEEEHKATGDLLFISCQEGYAKGLLTRKVIATMRAFHEAAGPAGNDACLNRPLFMKVDDDTFVASERFRLGLSSAYKSYGEKIFGGVVALYGPAQEVIRDPNSLWFEPEWTWPRDKFPPTMYGGPGYIMGRKLIRGILDQGIADKWTLWNEDRAVGVWVNELQTHGVQVHWVNIPGTNGYSWDYPELQTTWHDYPYVLHHHLSQSCINCLTDVDIRNDPTISLEPCFQMSPVSDPQNWKNKKE